MGANVLFAYGTDEQKRRWLPALARGEESWCQFFSEPGAGSDLASVQTRAVRDGDRWVVNGTKVWNSGTLNADRGLLVARTDPDVPKHRGISFFVIDLDQPGIDVRPIRQMNGRREFNETFFTDAVVTDDGLVGSLNAGFGIAMLTLGSERAEYAGGGEHAFIDAAPGRKAGMLERRIGDVMAGSQHQEMGGANTPPIHTTDHLVDLARRHGRASDPVIRQRIAGVHALSEALRLTAMRGRAAAEAGRSPGPESSILYLGGVQVIRRFRDLAAEIAGPAATLWGPDAPDQGDVAMTVVTAPCHGIQGGSEQIQRNIIGERLLGLPKEPSVDRDIPFRDVKVGTQRP
jgi:alkylation response protein AidB-like acyl-CoA dehydrogenase